MVERHTGNGFIPYRVFAGSLGSGNFGRESLVVERIAHFGICVCLACGYECLSLSVFDEIGNGDGRGSDDAVARDLVKVQTYEFVSQFGIGGICHPRDGFDGADVVVRGGEFIMSFAVDGIFHISDADIVATKVFVFHIDDRTVKIRLAVCFRRHGVALGADYAFHAGGGRYVVHGFAVGFAYLPVINRIIADKMSFVGNFLTRYVITRGGNEYAVLYVGINVRRG